MKSAMAKFPMREVTGSASASARQPNRGRLASQFSIGIFTFSVAVWTCAGCGTSEPQPANTAGASTISRPTLGDGLSGGGAVEVESPREQFLLARDPFPKESPEPEIVYRPSDMR